jgi:DNA repair photolyase
MGTEVVRQRGGVRYLELQARSLVNRCTQPRMPFRFTVNPYRGCAMGCRYCYATYTHEFMGITTPEDFHSTVYAKRGGEAETRRALAAAIRAGETIALGTATDPYQPGESDLGVTRSFLEKVAEHRGARLGITTKGAGILRDLDLLRRIHERSSLSIHVSLISMDAALLRKAEPWAPPPLVRLSVMRRLHAAGLDVSLNLAPILPGLTDDDGSLDRVLGRVREAGVGRLFWNVLFLRSPTREMYLRWIERAFPQLFPAYQAAYAERVYLKGAYRQRLAERVERLKAKHGFVARSDEAGGRDAPPTQMPLWESPAAPSTTMRR